MTYKCAADWLINNKTAKVGRTVTTNAVRREAWEDGKILFVDEDGHIRLGIASLNPSTGRHCAPSTKYVVISIEDLAGKDWETVQGKDYF